MTPPPRRHTEVLARDNALAGPPSAGGRLRRRQAPGLGRRRGRVAHRPGPRPAAARACAGQRTRRAAGGRARRGAAVRVGPVRPRRVLQQPPPRAARATVAGRGRGRSRPGSRWRAFGGRAAAGGGTFRASAAGRRRDQRAPRGLPRHPCGRRAGPAHGARGILCQPGGGAIMGGPERAVPGRRSRRGRKLWPWRGPRSSGDSRPWASPPMAVEPSFSRCG